MTDNFVGFTFFSQGLGNFKDFKKFDRDHKVWKEDTGKVVFYLFTLSKEPGFHWIHFFPFVPVQHHVSKPKSKKTNPEVELRRSSRVRNPVPSYTEDVSDIVFQTTIMQDQTTNMGAKKE